MGLSSQQNRKLCECNESECQCMYVSNVKVCKGHKGIKPKKKKTKTKTKKIKFYCFSILFSLFFLYIYIYVIRSFVCLPLQIVSLSRMGWM